MSFVTNQQLQKLRCLKCRKYLSYFPIYQSYDQQGCICGRCSVEGNVERNTIYEEVTTIQKFPCCYDVSGCLDSLYPDEVPIHEKFCKFRTYDCPSNTTSKCKWRGLVKDMWDHFQRHHAIYTIKNNEFEIDLVGNYSENYLLNVEDELYIVNQSNSRSNSFSCNVSYIGCNINSQSYSYKLTFTNMRNRLNNFAISEKLGEGINLDRTFITESLGNPSIVLVRIQIVTQEDNENHFEEVQWELLEELECSYCLEFLLPPVQQCITGHSICSNCKMTQSVCPTCTKDFKDTVNITLGKLIDHLVYPCKNEGCNFTCKAKDISEHYSKCIYGKFKCPLHDYENCSEEIYYTGLYDHILTNHYENLLEMDTVSVPFKIYHEENETEPGDDDKNLNEDCFILRYDFRLFKLHYKYENGMFQWEMQLIGSTNEDKKYDFEVDVVDNRRNQRIFFKRECSTLSSKTEAFAEDRSFIYIDIDQVHSMIDEELIYSVRILPKS
ncbi:E3 ubiquitin-protein ligase sina-like [Anoplophora glabripennis]|uniref:E3 ubiquitin-protein ligase sina-like n=1 Tax=Anoplophora glabripennis TaxID=217634 RepID=UPI000C7681CA|nr:E3 ubiquitin-protein ligase sina-like [Anoplophora glabripennis]